MTTPVRVALVVPEYRTAQAPGGGVATVAEFVANAVRDHLPEWQLEVFSPRMWHGAAENRRLLSPSTWVRGVTTSQGCVAGRTVTYVGADWAEIEAMRYRPRAPLTRLLRGFDVIMIVSGSPASFSVAGTVDRPIVGHFATTIAEERRTARATGTLKSRVKARVSERLVRRAERQGLQIPETVMAMNPVMQSWCANLVDRRVVLVPGGIDPAIFSPPHCAYSRPRNLPEQYVLSVGRLGDPRKDVPTLVRAFNHAVTSRGLTHHLVLAGNQLPPESAFTLARNFGIEDRIHVILRPDQTELVTLYQGADLFAMASREEGLGMVQIEAHATGLPVVSTRTVGAEYILDDSNAGILVEFGDRLAERLGDAIADLALSVDRKALAAHESVRLAQRFHSQQLGRRVAEELLALQPR